MKLKLAALVIASASALCPSALAEDPPLMLYDELISKCDADHSWCVKTITDSQVQDMLPFIFAPHVIKRKYCLPQGISAEDSTVPVIDWIKARKDYYSGYPAYKAVQDAEARLWPCRQ